MAEGERASRLGLPGFPREAETIVLDRDLRLVALTGARYHAALVSNRLSLAAMRARARRGPSRHLRRLDQQSHPQRNRRRRLSHFPEAQRRRCAREDERLALVEALADGLIDVIVSDHDPQDVETKRLPFAEAAAGAIGVETMLSAGLRLVSGGRCRPAASDARDDAAPRGNPRPAGGPARDRRAGRPDPLRSRRALCARSRRRCIRAAATRPSTRRAWKGGSNSRWLPEGSRTNRLGTVFRLASGAVRRWRFPSAQSLRARARLSAAARSRSACC